MNKGQSVVVTKQKGLVSRIISTIIVFGVTCVVVCGGVAGLYFAFPSKVGPTCKKFGFLERQEPVTKIRKEATVAKETPQTHLICTLNDEDWQRLRSTNVILLATDKGDGFRVISPPEKEQGLNDNDLEALIPISSRILTLDLTYAEITDRGITALSKVREFRTIVLGRKQEVTVQGLAQSKKS